MSTYSIYGLLVGIFVFMLGRTIISYREEARRFRLAERLHNTQKLELLLFYRKNSIIILAMVDFIELYYLQFQRNPSFHKDGSAFTG